MNPLVRNTCLFFFLLTAVNSFGQVTPSEPLPKDTVKEFQIIKGPSMRAIKIDSVTTLQTIAGGAVIRQGSTLFNSDSAVVNPVAHTMEAFGNIVINQADTVHTYGQYLKYLGVEKIAYLKNKVKLTSKSGTLYTDDLDYNLQTGIGNFHNGGKVIEGKTTITSIDGTYYEDTKDIYFKNNVKLDEPQKHIRADSLLYNMQTRKSNFISRTHILTPEVEINTTEGNYDLNSGNAFFSSRTTVKDSSGRLYSANTMALENISGNAQLEGNAVIIDSAGGYTIIANQIYLNKVKNSFLATRKPVLILKQKNDSIYIAGDTIYSGFTAFVGERGHLLHKDSTIHINPQEDQKVRETLLRDSTEIPVFAQRPVPIDSTEIPERRSDAALKLPAGKLLPARDEMPTLTGTDSLHENRPVIDSLTDTLKRHRLLRSPEDTVKRDSLIDKMGSLKNHANLIPRKDSIPREKIIHRAPFDSIPLHDSLPRHIAVAGHPDSSVIDSSGILRGISVPDSLRTFSLAEQDSIDRKDTTIRYFLAFHHVKIYNDSLQSVCDSMFISSRDSVFRLYYDPVVWSGSTQIAGDTIFLYTKNKQPERLYVFESGLIVNRTKEGFFNQMSGKTINGYFVDGKIDYMRVKGTQSESIYYMQDDDSAYIGMNRATGDVIDLYFKNQDLNKVIFINQIEGKMYPMNQIPEDQKKLKIFKWLEDRRPKNKAALFE